MTNAVPALEKWIPYFAALCKTYGHPFSKPVCKYCDQYSPRLCLYPGIPIALNSRYALSCGSGLVWSAHAYLCRESFRLVGYVCILHVKFCPIFSPPFVNHLTCLIKSMTVPSCILPLQSFLHTDRLELTVIFSAFSFKSSCVCETEPTTQSVVLSQS